MRGPIAERLSRSVIESVPHVLELGLGHLSQGSVFWEELADEPIRIFVDPPFPGCIRMRKVNLGITILRHARMITEFTAIVIRDGGHPRFVRL